MNFYHFLKFTVGKPEVITNWLFSKQRTHELTIVFLWFILRSECFIMPASLQTVFVRFTSQLTAGLPFSMRTSSSCLFLFCRNEKGLLNFVRERIIFLKPVYRINNTWYSFQKNQLPFKLVKPHFIGHTLSNWSPYVNINYCFTGRALKIYDLLYSTLKQVKHNS